MLGEAIAEFFASPAGDAALAVLAVGFLDFVLQALADYRDKRLRPDEFDEWLRVDLAGTILPIWLLLFVGYFARGIQFANIPLILAAGIGAAGVYVIAVVSRIVRAWGPGRDKMGGANAAGDTGDDR